MLTLGTKTLMIIAVICGLGIGIAAPFSVGLYSAMLLFAFPFLAAVMGLLIIRDMSRPRPVRIEKQLSSKPAPMRAVPQMPMVMSHRIN